MKAVLSRRALRHGTCTAVLGLLAAGLTAVPALAQSESDQLWIVAPSEMTVTAADAGGTPPTRTLAMRLSHDNSNFTVTDGRLTVDVSGLAGVAEVTWPEQCTPSGSTAVCAFPEVLTEQNATADVLIRAADSAAPGAQGAITYTAEATGGPEGHLVAVGTETVVQVQAASPDLSLAEPAPIGGVRPGSTVTVPFAVVNRGNGSAAGIRMTMYASRGLDLVTELPQCTYPPLDDDPVRVITCSFDDVVAPGGTFTLPAQLRLALASYAYKERLDIGIEPGSGTDIDPFDNFVSQDIAAVNTADFAVRGADLTGKAGQTVTVDLDFRNRGPAWVAHLGSGEPAAVLDFQLPPGTTVVSLPDECSAIEEPPSSRYYCWLPYWAEERSEHRFAFLLKIDTVVKNATGRLSLLGSLPFDPNPRNNTAKIVLNAAPRG